MTQRLCVAICAILMLNGCGTEDESSSEDPQATAGGEDVVSSDDISDEPQDDTAQADDTEPGTDSEGVPDEGAEPADTADTEQSDPGEPSPDEQSGPTSCKNPFVVSLLPFAIATGTAGPSELSLKQGTACHPDGGGAESAEMVFAFTPQISGSYRVTGSAETPLLLYVVTSCDSPSDSCVSAGAGPLVVALSAGTTYFIIVDGDGDALSQATVQIAVADAPPLPPAKTGCEAVAAVACGAPSPSLSPAEASESESYSCVDGDFAGGEIALRYEAIGDGTVTLNAPGAAAVAVFETDVCGDLSACVAGAKDSTSFEAKTGTTYHVIVEAATAVTVSLECSTPPPTLGCGLKSPGALPWQESGATNDATDDFSLEIGDCPGINGSVGSGAKDALIGFLPAASGSYDFELTADFDAVLYALKVCEGPISCFGGAHAPGAAKKETLTLSLDAGVPVYLVVDGAFASEAGSFSLSAKKPCISTCGNKACGPDGCGGTCGTCQVGSVCSDGACTDVPTSCVPKATVSCGETVSDLDANAVGAFSVFSSYSCQPFDLIDYGEGNEVALGFTTDESVLVEVSAPKAVGLDVYVLSGECSNKGVCVGFGSSSVSFAAEAGTEYFLVWDSGTASTSTPPFDVTLSCKSSVSGDHCETATPLVDKAVGTNAGLSDNHAAKGCSGGVANGFGGGQPDVFYEFEAPATGLYDFTLTADVVGQGPSVLVIRSACGKAGYCLAEKDFFGDITPLSLSMEAKQKVVVIVDSVKASEVGAYTLTVTGP